MLFDDTYKTLESPAEGLFKDKGSKFIGYAYPIFNENQVKDLLSLLRAEHGKARHFCWAYRLTADRSVFRIQDDGEPSGTAGRPILNTMLSADITNVLIVVVRYFGGTLLGVPGLINAYKTAAVDSINNGNIISKTIDDVYEVSFTYQSMNDVMRIIKEEQPRLLEQHFDNDCLIKMAVRQSALNILLSKLSKIEDLNMKYLFTDQ
ncbi:putative YigZ family protein [Pedobacter sp. UYP24]